MSVDSFEQVGMDKGEHHEANAFNLYDHVLVFLYALHVSFISFVNATGYSNMFIFLEILFIEDLASGRILRGEEPQEVDRRLRNHLHLIILGIPVDPEGNKHLGMFPTFSFEGKGIFTGCMNKENAWDKASLTLPFARNVYNLLWEKHLIAERRQNFLCFEILTSLYGKPLIINYLLQRVLCYIYDPFLRDEATKAINTLKLQPSVYKCFGSQG